MTEARTRFEETMAEGQDSHNLELDELVKELGDSVSDLGLTEKEEAPAAPTQKDGVAGELPAQEDPAAVDAAKEIVNQILDEVKTPTKGDEQEEEEAESGADHGAEVEEAHDREGGEEEEVEEAHDREGGEEEAKDADIVKDAAKRMEKLEIAESSEGGGSGSSAAEDDRSSSMDSTANSGARPAEGEETPSDDKGVSGEESPEGFTTERPKKRIDLQHQFVRGIVKIQHDRDQYEKQCQSKKQETPKDRDASVVEPTEPTEPTGAEEPTRSDSRSSNTSSRKRYEGGKRHYSSMESGKGGQRNYHLRNALVDDSLEQQQQHQHASRNKSEIYRPPGLRSTPTPVDRPRSVVSEAPEDVSLRITFDTEKQKRSIQLSKPSAAPGEGESNLVVTFDTTRKERHIETTGNTGRLQPQRWSDRDTAATRLQQQSWSDRNTGAASNNSNRYKDGELPSDFQFKATASGNGPSEAKVVRSSGSFRGSRPLADTGSTPKPLGDQHGFLVRNVRKEKAEDAPPGKERAFEASPAPPVESISPALTKDKGGNISLKSKPFAAEVKWSDIVESESEPSPTSDPIFTGIPDVVESNEWRSPGTNRRRGGPRKPRQKNSFRQQQQQEQAQNLQPDKSPSPQAPESQNSGGRRSVWERLGPRPWLDRPGSLKNVESEPGTMANMREMAERQYLDSNSENSESAVQAAYKDTKQKRTRMELYVPRRGGV